MIQRVQSLLLIGAAIIMILLLFFPIWNEQSPTLNQQTTLDAYTLTLASLEEDATTESAAGVQEESVAVAEVQQEESSMVIAILTVVSAITAFYAVFLFRKRKTQIKLSLLNYLLMLAVLGSSWYYSYEGEAFIPGKGTYDVGFFLPAIAILLNFFAIRYIRKDEKLVRSVDRLR